MKRTMVLLAIGLCACSAQGDDPKTPIQGPVVFLGDSITQLWPLESYIPGAINVGISGNMTGQMLARFDVDVLAHNPKVLVILGGTNDIRTLDSADASNLYTMAQRAKDAGIRVIIGTLPPADGNLGLYPSLEHEMFPVLDDKIRKGAQQYGYEVVDYTDAMQLADGSLNASLYMDAHLHPNQAGYEAMWAALEPVLRR